MHDCDILLTAVFLPEKRHKSRRAWRATEQPGGLQNSLVGYSLQGHKRAGHDFATKKQQQQTDQMTRAQVMSSK